MTEGHKQTIFVVETDYVDNEAKHTVYLRETKKAIAVDADSATAAKAMQDYLDGKDVPQMDVAREKGCC